MPVSMMVRLAWAAVSALVGGIWLWRRASAISPNLDVSEIRTVAALRRLLLALSAFWSITWLVIALIRLRYPFELEWCCGEMHDHCLRVLSGLPLYVRPGSGWFPYEYPPLYVWTSALLMRLLGDTSYAPMRTVSIISTLGSAALIFAWTRYAIDRQSQSQRNRIDSAKEQVPSDQRRRAVVWPIIAAGLFLASYRFTGAWYDVERLDMLFLFLSLLGIYWLEIGGLWTVPSALAFSLAFLTKQQAILFIFGAIGALAWRRRLRPFLSFTLTAVVVCAGSLRLLNAGSDGWFGYYCFQVPVGNGIHKELALRFLAFDLPLFLPVIALLTIFCIKTAIDWRRHRPILNGSGNPPTLLNRVRTLISQSESDAEVSASGAGLIFKDDSVLAAMTATGLLGSFLSRAHWGGFENVLITGFVTLGTAACIGAGRWERIIPAVAVPCYVLLLAQFIALVYRPNAQLPKPANVAVGERFTREVRVLEQKGEVLCLDHGGFTAVPHFQIMGLNDIIRSQKGLPRDLKEALRSHRYACILVDTRPGTTSVLDAEISKDYPLQSSLNFTSSWVITGYPTPSPARPIWVLRPRK